MKVVKTVLNTVLATIGGCLAGGAAGGAAFMLVGAFPNFSHAKSLGSAAAGFGIYLTGTFLGAFMGLIGGLIFGLVPTLVLGLLLSFIRRLRPFDRLPVWMLLGAAAGVAIQVWLPFTKPTAAMSGKQGAAWLAAWAVGGATAMAVFWAAGAHSFRQKADRL